MANSRSFKFIEAPPERSMRKKSPESAPRLFDWLVDNGYAESVTTYGKGGKRGKPSKADYLGGGLARAYSGGRVADGGKKKKKLPF